MLAPLLKAIALPLWIDEICDEMLSRHSWFPKDGFYRLPLMFYLMPSAGQRFHISSEISQCLLKFATDIHDFQMMYSDYFGDPLTFPFSATMRLTIVVLREIS